MSRGVPSKVLVLQATEKLQWIVLSHAWPNVRKTTQSARRVY
uniref:Uncharacterized protein n=1 Tax=Curvibacter symbiont subsp. Hydra magnipapillata TaxID=667019 RepID=C9YGY9_CURXX|nr:hypothetical protein Csp_B20390 [Curvibacter putative symbiont of Hydra magnipapillata]